MWGQFISFSVCPSRRSESAAVLLRDVSPREIAQTTHISHYCEVHVSLNAN